ncbi:DUF1415 domain-containing protein [Ramlibacter sp.]|uniref:DUF1415 domain-containing protein n=1 Tax=Ramlibacter sp. TaxID=1917967 RepID=UPI0017CD3328|nr:DUF1415 domain-containing protein [Ramlibacter sp.]MBA2673626.1 DUF1415 domain-containing protein [Ramlibacter sp.]
MQAVVEATRRWLERAVIGLNLCPFAKAVVVKQQVHFAVSYARDVPGVLEDLGRELDALLACVPQQRDTTLLIVPHGFDDFLDFTALVQPAQRLLRKRRLEGVLQLAEFHPRYVFAGNEDDDPGNRTNRAPYPILHLLREDSIDRAVSAFPDPADIYEANVATLERLGAEGWAALDVGPAR